MTPPQGSIQVLRNPIRVGCHISLKKVLRKCTVLCYLRYAVVVWYRISRKKALRNTCMVPYLKKSENTHTGTGRVSGPARYLQDSVSRAVLSPVAPDCWRCDAAGSYRRTFLARTCYVRSAWCSQSRRPRPGTRPRLGIACWSCTPDLETTNRSKNIFHIIHNSIQVIHPNART